VKIKILASSALALLLISVGVGVGIQKNISSRIVSRVHHELPKASRVSASVPLTQIPSDIASDVIKSVEVNIGQYSLKGSTLKPSLKINAANVTKSQPTLIGTLDVTATIPTSTITALAGFRNAEIVGNALQISVGQAGLGKALLIPKFSNNQLYFHLQSVSILGNQIPTSSLPSNIQDQIKTKSTRNLSFPKGLAETSVSLSSKGLSIRLHGSNLHLGKIGQTL
jgi:hypothetical protein